MIVDRRHEMFQPLRNRMKVLQPVLPADIVAEKDERPYSPVNLWSDDTLRHEASVHSHRVIFPVFDKAVHIERGEKRNILFCQIIHDIVSHPAVGHIYHSCHIHAVGMSPAEECSGKSHRIDHVSGLFKPAYEVGRLAHLPCEDDSGGIGIIKPAGFQERLIFRHRIEAEVLVARIGGIRMIKHVVCTLHSHLRLGSLENFPVHMPAHIRKHVLVVGTASSGDILPYGCIVCGVK